MTVADRLKEEGSKVEKGGIKWEGIQDRGVGFAEEREESFFLRGSVVIQINVPLSVEAIPLGSTVHFR